MQPPDPIDLIVLAAYAALAFELTFLSVPSVVSTRALLRRHRAATLAERVAAVGPLPVILVLFLIPPAAALWPAVLDRLVPLPQLAVPAVRSAGAVLLLGSRLLSLLAFRPLRRALAAGTLARSGPFACGRHPVLASLLAFYLGAALIYPSAVLLLGFPLLALHMHRRALLEEQHLHERFGSDYAEYAARVPRYAGVRRRPRRPP